MPRPGRRCVAQPGFLHLGEITGLTQPVFLENTPTVRPTAEPARVPIQGDPCMNRWFLISSLLAIGFGWTLASATEAAERPSVERGRDAVVAWKLNPGIWSV